MNVHSLGPPPPEPPRPRRKASKTPTARSLEECRKREWRAQVVEKWIGAPTAPFSQKRRVDLWGFGDVIALDGKPGSLLIQACSAGDAATRAHKIAGECREAAHDWLAAGNRIEVWGWRKLIGTGRWTLARYRVARAIQDVHVGPRLFYERLDAVEGDKWGRTWL